MRCEICRGPFTADQRVDADLATQSLCKNCRVRDKYEPFYEGYFFGYLMAIGGSLFLWFFMALSWLSLAIALGFNLSALMGMKRFVRSFGQEEYVSVSQQKSKTKGQDAFGCIVGFVLGLIVTTVCFSIFVRL